MLFNIIMRQTMYGAIVPIILLVGLGGTVIISQFETESQTDVGVVEDTNGTYTASATILAVTSLGSAISVRMSKNVKLADMQGGGIFMMFGSIFAVILTQMMIMLDACCFGLQKSTLAIYVILTIASLLCMVYGYMLLTVVQARDSKRNVEHLQGVDDAENNYTKTEASHESKDPDK